MLVLLFRKSRISCKFLQAPQLGFAGWIWPVLGPFLQSENPLKIVPFALT
jgi:hypothetical protein